jgi:hypothetical protein
MPRDQLPFDDKKSTGFSRLCRCASGYPCDQPGFRIDTKEYSYKTAFGMMFMDALSDMYHSAIIREKQEARRRKSPTDI